MSAYWLILIVIIVPSGIFLYHQKKREFRKKFDFLPERKLFGQKRQSKSYARDLSSDFENEVNCDVCGSEEKHVVLDVNTYHLLFIIVKSEVVDCRGYCREHSDEGHLSDGLTCYM